MYAWDHGRLSTFLFEARLVFEPKRFAFLLLTMFFCTIPVVSQEPSHHPDVQQVAEAIRNQEYSQAIQIADAGLTKTPKDVQLWTLRGIAAQKGGNVETAAKSFETALKFSPNYLPALEGAAETYYRSGSDKAEPMLLRVLELKPEDPTAHAMLGAIAYRRGDCKDALGHFRHAQSAISSNAVALAQFGSCLSITEHAKDAVPVLRTALELSPEDRRIRLVLADAQYGSGEPAAALQTLAPLLSAESIEADTLALASSAWESLGDTPKAVEMLRRAIVTSPRNPQYYLDFSSLCFNHSSFDVGVDMLTAGLTQLPESAPLYLARGVLNVQRAKYADAEADFAAAGRIDPNQNLAAAAQGLTLVQQDRLDSALQTARDESQKHPEDAFLHYLIAEILEQKGATPETAEFNQAITEGEQAVKLNPQFVLAHDALSGMYLKVGRIDLAEREAQTALRLSPSDQVALYHLIQALRKLGDQKELPQLVSRLAELRRDTREKEEQQNRYKIFEVKPD
jgi:tetratricopeptide (TPR) repeat protein